ncbi:unnamed protein product [Closterium sp. NIES-65]|nr:unnamed protein product [Closterium sp. NIES-65]
MVTLAPPSLRGVPPPPSCPLLPLLLRPTSLVSSRSALRLPRAGDAAPARAREARALEGLAGAVAVVVEAVEGVGMVVGVVAGVEVSVAAVEAAEAAAVAEGAEAAEVVEAAEAAEVAEAAAAAVDLVAALRRGVAPVVVRASNSRAVVRPCPLSSFVSAPSLNLLRNAGFEEASIAADWPSPLSAWVSLVPGAAAQQGQVAGVVQGEGGGGGELPPGDLSVAAEGGRFVHLQPSDGCGGTGGELWGSGASEREGAVWPVQGLGQLLSMIVAVPLSTTAGSTGSSVDEAELARALAGAMSSGAADMMVLHEWTVGVPCRNNSYSLSGLMPWRQHGPYSFHLPPSPASAAALSFPAQGVALHLVLLEGSAADSSSTPSAATVELPVLAPLPPIVPGGASVASAAAVEGGELTSAAAAAGNIDVDLITVAPRGTGALTVIRFLGSLVSFLGSHVLTPLTTGRLKWQQELQWQQQPATSAQPGSGV